MPPFRCHTATVLALCCCAWGVVAQGRLDLGKGEPHLGKGHGRCFGECVQPGMGISFFWRSFWVLRELRCLYHSFPEQQAGMKSLCLLVGVKTRLVSGDLVPSRDLGRQERRATSLGSWSCFLLRIHCNRAEHSGQPVVNSELPLPQPCWDHPIPALRPHSSLEAELQGKRAAAQLPAAQGLVNTHTQAKQIDNINWGFNAKQKQMVYQGGRRQCSGLSDKVDEPGTTLEKEDKRY